VAIQNESVREKESIHVAKEILKTPFRPLHLLLLKNVTQSDAVSPRFLFKMLSSWQRQLKIHLDFSLTMEEKKCEIQTRDLVAKFCTNEAAVEFLTSTDAATKLTREERMHVVPILCKYCPD